MVSSLLQTREAAILALMGFTWMTSQTSSLKWQPFISLRGITQTHSHNFYAIKHTDIAELNHTCWSILIKTLLYSDGGAAVRSISDPGLHSSSLSPQSLSSGGDSGVDSYCDNMADMPSIAISLCGGLNENREITTGKTITPTLHDHRKHWVE